MANDRYRYDQDRNRNQDFDRGSREDDGYIARLGFGNRSAGYDRGSGSDGDQGRGRERDFGDSAGYGTGGSALDWHDVVGNDRGYDDRTVFNTGSRNTGSRNTGSGNTGSDSFGRGSRDYNEDRGFLERAGDEVRSWFGGGEAEGRRDGGTREAGGHRGRGPKGYQRSDARILEDVNDRLTEDPHLDASEIEVSVAGREVTLAGTVNSRFEKRHAEDLAESVSGVAHVQNNLRVQQAADAGMGGSMLSGAGAAGAGTTGTGRRDGGGSHSGG